jgi:Ca2+-transporting ATPase
MILGNILEKMNDSELTERLYRNDNVKVFARTKPEQKLKIVQALKNKDEVVAMMGDGVNDAPALTAADIGVVVGEATDVAKESADLVLLDSSFNTIVLAVEEGRGIFDNLRKMVLYLLCDGFVEIILVVISIIAKLPLPITAAQILWVNLVSDGFPNLALTVDPKEPKTMSKPPRPPKELLVSIWMKELIAVVSFVGGLFAFVLFYHSYQQTGDAQLARSVAFATVGVNSLVYVFSIKALRQQFWNAKIFNNKWLILAVFAGLLLQIAPFTIPFLKEAFEVTNIGFYWFYVTAAAFGMMFVIEILKAVFNFEERMHQQHENI